MSATMPLADEGGRCTGAVDTATRVRASPVYRALTSALATFGTPLLPELFALVADYAIVLEHEWDASQTSRSIEVSAADTRVLCVRPCSDWSGAFACSPLRCGALSWLIRFHENTSGGTIGVALPGVALTDPPRFGTSYGAWGVYTDRHLYTYSEPNRASGQPPKLLANPTGDLPAAFFPAVGGGVRSWDGVVTDVSVLRQRKWMRTDVTLAEVRMGCGTVLRVDCDLARNTVSFAVTHWYDPKTKAPFAVLPPFVALGVAYHIPELADCVPYCGVSDGSYAILPVTTPDNELLNPAVYSVMPPSSSSAAAPAK